jgi:hypothetical protein
MEKPGISLKRDASRTFPVLLVGIHLVAVLTVLVSASTPPQQPRISVSVGNRTVAPGSGIDVSVRWEQNAVSYPVPPERIEISLLTIPDGLLVGTYPIPKTKESNEGAIRQYDGTIPGSVLPAGEFALVATDPVSGESDPTEIAILAPGESYQSYRLHQVTEGIFYPVAAVLIACLAIVLVALVLR